MTNEEHLVALEIKLTVLTQNVIKMLEQLNNAYSAIDLLSQRVEELENEREE